MERDGRRVAAVTMRLSAVSGVSGKALSVANTAAKEREGSGGASESATPSGRTQGSPETVSNPLRSPCWRVLPGVVERGREGDVAPRLLCRDGLSFASRRGLDFVPENCVVCQHQETSKTKDVADTMNSCSRRSAKIQPSAPSEPAAKSFLPSLRVKAFRRI